MYGIVTAGLSSLCDLRSVICCLCDLLVIKNSNMYAGFLFQFIFKN